MADVTVEEAMEKYGPCEGTRGDLLELNDSNDTPENVAERVVRTASCPVLTLRRQDD